MDAERRQAEHLAHAYEPVPDEVTTELRCTSGSLPEKLRGVLYRNGPGRLERGGVPYGHPFDGDGHIVRIECSDAGVKYTNRFVRTPEYLAEERADAILFRNFGTNIPGGLRRNLFRTRFKNAANTSVHFHAGKLLALWEGGVPWELDPESLQTRGRMTFQDTLIDRSVWGRLFGEEIPFSAHPRRDPSSRSLFNFGVQSGGNGHTLRIYEWTEAGHFSILHTVRLERMPFVHDFLLTPNHFIFFLCPVDFKVGSMLLGLSTAVDSIVEASRATEILFVPRDGSATWRVPVRPSFVFHHLNAYEDGDSIVIDSARMDRYPVFPTLAALRNAVLARLPPPTPSRVEIHRATRTAREFSLASTACELPTIHPDRTGQPYRHAWCITRPATSEGTLFTAVAHLHLPDGSAILHDWGPSLPGEPLFVPHPNAAHEAHGWALTLVYDPEKHRSEFVVFDADSMEILARFELPHHVPPGFHGTFVPAT